MIWQISEFKIINFKIAVLFVEINGNFALRLNYANSWIDRKKSNEVNTSNKSGSITVGQVWHLSEPE